jgi:hypothetical protein
VSRVLAEAPAPSIPPELISRIDEALAAAATEQPVAVHPRWRRVHLVVAAAAAVGVVAVGGVTLLRPATTDTAQAPSSAERAKPPAVADARPEAVTPKGDERPGYPPLSTSGINYRKSELAGQLADATARLGGRSAPGTTRGSTGGPLSVRLGGCIDRISDGRVPVLIDLARYEDAPATIIVFPEKSGDLDVWVTGPGCGQDDSDVIEHTEVSR